MEGTGTLETLDATPKLTILDTVALRVDQVLYVKFSRLGTKDARAYVYWLNNDLARLELDGKDADDLCRMVKT